MNMKVLWLALGFILLASLFTMTFIFVKDYDKVGDGLIYKISAIDLQKNIINIKQCIYTPNNKIVFSYTNSDTNQSYLGIMDENSTNLHNIYEGEIPSVKGANGARIMPYSDNKRLVTGDFVIETEPDLDNCDITKTKLYQLSIQMKLPQIVGL